jgi:hypothetical protein
MCLAQAKMYYENRQPDPMHQLLKDNFDFARQCKASGDKAKNNML